VCGEVSIWRITEVLLTDLANNTVFWKKLHLSIFYPENEFIFEKKWFFDEGYKAIEHSVNINDYYIQFKVLKKDTQHLPLFFGEDKVMNNDLGLSDMFIYNIYRIAHGDLDGLEIFEVKEDNQKPKFLIHMTYYDGHETFTYKIMLQPLHADFISLLKRIFLVYRGKEAIEKIASKQELFESGLMNVELILENDKEEDLPVNH
jgi:hypothetical protein